MLSCRAVGTDTDCYLLLEQVTQQARLENQIIPLRRQCDLAAKDRDAGVQLEC